MTYIGAPPASFVIPATLGADREFTVNRVDSDGDPVDWDAAVRIAIDIDRNNPTIITATVTGNQAVLLLPATVLDRVKNNTTRWRLYMDADTVTAVAVGYFERDDGGQQ